jgi:hypothetical protein
MRTTTDANRHHLAPRNRRSYPVLATEQALTRAQVLAARKADVAPKHMVELRAA